MTESRREDSLHSNGNSTSLISSLSSLPPTFIFAAMTSLTPASPPQMLCFVVDSRLADAVTQIYPASFPLLQIIKHKKITTTTAATSAANAAAHRYRLLLLLDRDEQGTTKPDFVREHAHTMYTIYQDQRSGHQHEHLHPYHHHYFSGRILAFFQSELTAALVDLTGTSKATFA